MSERETATSAAIKKCAEWLADCLRVGWDRGSLDALESLWWEHHDSFGNLKPAEARAALEQPASEPVAWMLTYGGDCVDVFRSKLWTQERLDRLNREFPDDTKHRGMVPLYAAPPIAEITPEDLARAFHDEYERLAPSFGYETRQDTRTFDPESANGKLMIAVAAALLRKAYL